MTQPSFDQSVLQHLRTKNTETCQGFAVGQVVLFITSWGEDKWVRIVSFRKSIFDDGTVARCQSLDGYYLPNVNYTYIPINMLIPEKRPRSMMRSLMSIV